MGNLDSLMFAGVPASFAQLLAQQPAEPERVNLTPYPLRVDNGRRAVYPEGCEQFDRFRQPTAAQERAAAVVSADEADDRRDAAMRCADSMQDFITGHCAYKYDVILPALRRDALDLGCALVAATVPQLLCLVMHERPDVRAAAGGQLRTRYLASQGVEE
jgi:hypothetical protein